MLLASFSLPAEALALEHTARTVPDIEIGAERIAAHSTKWVMPCLWVSHSDFDEVEASFRSDPSVDRIVETTRFDDEAFYHVEWADEVEGRVNTYLDKEGSMLDARLHGRKWQVEFRFASREQLDEFCEHLSDEGHAFRLIGLSDPTTPHQGYEDLTPAQRNALVTAAERGYFRVPREATTDDIADELDISHQAISELLRRGTENLVLSTLTVENGERSR